MKFFQQQGSGLKRTNLAESDNLCECCRTFEHPPSEYHIDDAVCDRCSALCRCGCHREPRGR